MRSSPRLSTGGWRTWTVVLASLPGLAACDGWPRWSNLPPLEGDVAATEDPRVLFDIAWTSVDETGENDTTVAAQSMDLPRSSGLHVSGALDGVGWYDQAEPLVITGEACGSSGTRSPDEIGDYIGDVDFYVLRPQEDATLCARARMGAATYGWDLLLYELDPCNVPVGVATDPEGAVLGYGGGGADGGWGANVTGGTTWAVLIAGYYPNDAEASVSYELGLTLVGRDSSGEPGLCPLLPGETP